jgi:hypothetical protein
LSRRSIQRTQLRSRIDLFGGEQYRDFSRDRSDGVDGQRERGRSDVVRPIDDDEQIGLTKGVVKSLDPGAGRFKQLFNGRAAAGAAFFEQALDAFTGIVGLSKLLGHFSLLDGGWV